MGKRLHNILQHFDYSVVNDQSTRITSETSTLIDLVIASKPNTMKCTKTPELGISDHLWVYASERTRLSDLHRKWLQLDLINDLTTKRLERMLRKHRGLSSLSLTIPMTASGPGNTFLMKYVIDTLPIGKLKLDNSHYLG